MKRTFCVLSFPECTRIVSTPEHRKELKLALADVLKRAEVQKKYADSLCTPLMSKGG